MSERAEQIAESHGDEALAAYRSGGEWEWSPDSIEYGDEWAYDCGDSDCQRRWHKHWIMSGWRISKGRVFHEIHECDEDGYWDYLEECDVDDPAYEKWAHNWTDEEERKAGWEDYAAYVAETGLDPLGNYYTRDTRKEAWTAKLEQGIHGIEFMGAHRKSLGYIERVAETDAAKLPKEAFEWLSLKLIEGRYYAQDVAHLDLLDGDHYVLDRHPDHALITFEIEVAEDEETVRQRRREAARGDDTQ